MNNNKKPSIHQILFVSSLLLFSNSLSAEWFEEKKAESFENAFTEGTAHLDFRLRYEVIKQGNQGSQALTLRSRLGFETLPYELFSAFIEFDDVRAIPSDDNYNSGANNQLDDVFLEDPEGTELNQAWIAYDIANTFIKYGRQTISLNNERLLGGDSWRQNEQTFSGLSIRNELLNYTRIEFAQINHVQTNQSESLSSSHQDINAKLFNLNYRGFWLNDISLYALWISDHPDQHQWETSTYGIRFAGDFGSNVGGGFSIAYQLEFAQQEDAGENPINYSTTYSLTDLVLAYQGVKVNLGYERLGASNGAYFVTPLGSLNSFQGASDKFSNDGLGNIQGGIQDSYLGLGYSVNLELAQRSLPIAVSLNYHDFRADSVINNISHLGEEWNIRASIELDQYEVLVQYADYHADHYGKSDQHVWLALNMSFK